MKVFALHPRAAAEEDWVVTAMGLNKNCFSDARSRAATSGYSLAVSVE